MSRIVFIWILIITDFYCLITGFSIGDELGFSQSISNLESAKRRSVKTHKINGLVSNSLNMVSVDLLCKYTEYLKFYNSEY